MENTDTLDKRNVDVAAAWAQLQASSDQGQPLQADAYRLAFADPEFLLRRETRGIRFQLEMLKPDLEQQAHGVENTIVVFGSARFRSEEQAQALVAVRAALGADFAAACRRLLACTGRVVCTGMGKSGHIATKIAATLASTGTPAFFMHPGEASHGDLGMVTDADVVLALSNSGESEEILAIVPALRRQGNVLITMTVRPGSSPANSWRAWRVRTTTASGATSATPSRTRRSRSSTCARDGAGPAGSSPRCCARRPKRR